MEEARLREMLEVEQMVSLVGRQRDRSVVSQILEGGLVWLLELMSVSDSIPESANKMSLVSKTMTRLGTNNNRLVFKHVEALPFKFF